MAEISTAKNVEKQNSISVLLILANILLGFIFLFCTPRHENDFFLGLLAVGVFSLLLQSVFVFTYKGKAPVASKIILVAILIIVLLYALFIGYAFALGKAFQH